MSYPSLSAILTSAAGLMVSALRVSSELPFIQPLPFSQTEPRPTVFSVTLSGLVAVSFGLKFDSGLFEPVSLEVAEKELPPGHHHRHLQDQ